jgi:6-phosphogluconolactonase (cycloisomerase 2 family)
VSNNISIFPITSLGLLTGGTTSTALSGAADLVNVAVDPSGKYLYALDAGNGSTTNGTIYGFNLNNDGSLGAALSPATITTGGLSPIGLAIDATGTLVASENNDTSAATSTIALFKITTGNLSADTAATTGPAPIFVTFLNAP